MERYGTTTRQLAEVSMAFRNNALLNPDAVMRKPITIEDHELARRIVEPFGLLDYCLVNDGAVCIIMTTTERARDLVKPPVLISGVGARDAFKRSSIANFDDDFWYSEIKDAGKQAYEMAGVKPEDVHSLMCYDNFSATVLFSLEGLGFCQRGESGAFVEGCALGLNGKLPTNTDGGHLSNSYMQGWALNIEAVRQLRGECGARQLPNCEVVQYIAATPCTRSIIYTRG
jgi:acetyl-CoA acetyltransferase